MKFNFYFENQQKLCCCRAFLKYAMTLTTLSLGTSSLETLDVLTYNKVMNAWQMCEQNNSDLSFSPSKNAEEILDYLCAQHEAGVEGLLPNDVSFSICIHSWCKSPQPDAIDRAVEILRKKEAFSKKESSVFMKITDWNTVISKLREYPAEGPDRASKLFEELIVRYNETQDGRSAPTTVTLNALLDVYAKNTKPDSAEKAEGILNNMNQLYEDGKSSVLPDVISYRTCMDAWIRQRQPKTPNKVESLLHEMMEKYRKGRTDLLPDSNSFK